MTSQYSTFAPRLAFAALLVSLFAVAAFSVLSYGAPAHASQTWNVSMYGDDMSQDYEFIPAVVNISVGDSVNWTSAAGSHTSTAAPNQAEYWDSGVLTPGQSFAHTFTIPGTYNYSSLIDPEMYGTVNVSQPAPEFPGFTVAVAVGLAAFFGLLLERKFRE